MKKSRLLGAVCAYAFLSITVIAPAHSAVIDQQQLLTDTGFCNHLPNGTCSWQQEVIAGVSGQLVGMDVFLSTATSGSFDIWLGSPWQSGAPIFSTPFTATSGGTAYIDLSAANIDLLINNSFTFEISNVTTGLIRGTSTNSYAGNLNLGYDGTVYTNYAQHDLAFKSYMAPVPIPPALWLFGSGLLGLVGIARRKAS